MQEILRSPKRRCARCTIRLKLEALRVTHLLESHHCRCRGPLYGAGERPYDSHCYGHFRALLKLRVQVTRHVPIFRLHCHRRPPGKESLAHLKVYKNSILAGGPGALLVFFESENGSAAAGLEAKGRVARVPARVCVREKHSLATGSVARGTA